MDIKNGDEFTKEFDTKEEAINFADNIWNHLSNYDKKHREAFYVLETTNPDEDAENHFDGDIIKEYC